MSIQDETKARKIFGLWQGRERGTYPQRSVIRSAPGQRLSLDEINAEIKAARAKRRA